MNRDLTDGNPSMNFEPLHVGRPNIGDRKVFHDRVNDILDRRWLTNSGPYCVEFEARLAEMLGVRHCIAVCSATVGLEITIRALELKGEVIVAFDAEMEDPCLIAAMDQADFLRSLEMDDKLRTTAKQPFVS